MDFHPYMKNSWNPMPMSSKWQRRFYRVDKEKVMMMSSRKPTGPDARENEETGIGVAVPVDLQIELAENRRSLAEFRYEMNVRMGSAWNVREHGNSAYE